MTYHTAVLRLPISQPLYAQYSTGNPDLFDLISLLPFSAHLCLYCAPDEYKPVEQELGSTEVTVGYGSAIVTPAAKLYGFEISTVESRPVAYEILRSLNKTAVATAGVYQPITVWDSHHIHEDGLIAVFGGVRYCQRRVRLQALTPQGGSIVQGAQRYSAGGFTVRFMELQPRDAY
jgi:hypothetical protein